MHSSENQKYALKITFVKNKYNNLEFIKEYFLMRFLKILNLKNKLIKFELKKKKKLINKQLMYYLLPN